MLIHVVICKRILSEAFSPVIRYDYNIFSAYRLLIDQKIYRLTQRYNEFSWVISGLKINVRIRQRTLLQQRVLTNKPYSQKKSSLFLPIDHTKSVQEIFICFSQFAKSTSNAFSMGQQTRQHSNYLRRLHSTTLQIALIGTSQSFE